MDVGRALEWSTVIGATALLFFIGFLSIPVLYFVETPPREPDMIVKVVARQWAWEFRYPDGSSSSNLVVRAGELVKLEMTSEDVIHSFFVRDLGFKIDVFPAKTRDLWMQPEQAGEYWIQCAEFCGTFHGTMRTKLVVQGGA